MAKHEKIERFNRQQLLTNLSSMPPMVIATAYLHAINYTNYGVDVTEKWLTAVEQSSSLEKAYHDGYYDALKLKEIRWIPVSEKLPEIHNYSEKYLVTLKRGGVYIATFTECNGKHWWTYNDVEAWMPLPEPYKADGGEEDGNN